MSAGVIEVEPEAPSDPRFARLAQLAGLVDADQAFGRVARLWAACFRLQTRALPEDVVCSVLGPGGPAALVDARLGERLLTGEIRVKGSDRLKWRARRADDDDGKAGPRERQTVFTETERATAGKVLERLAAKTGVNYRAAADGNVEHVVRLLRRGYTERDLLRVVWHRWLAWHDDEKMASYLRPATLFRPSNFASYLPQANAEAEAAKVERDNAQRAVEAAPTFFRGEDQ